MLLVALVLFHKFAVAQPIGFRWELATRDALACVAYSDLDHRPFYNGRPIEDRNRGDPRSPHLRLAAAGHRWPRVYRDL
jgi:hypothetical protein